MQKHLESIAFEINFIDLHKGYSNESYIIFKICRDGRRRFRWVLFCIVCFLEGFIFWGWGYLKTILSFVYKNIKHA